MCVCVRVCMCVRVRVRACACVCVHVHNYYVDIRIIMYRSSSFRKTCPCPQFQRHYAGKNEEAQFNFDELYYVSYTYIAS